MKRSPLQKALTGIVGALLALLALYWFGVAAVVPWLVRREIARWQAETPGVTVSLGTFSVDPWTWRLWVRNLSLRIAQPQRGADTLTLAAADAQIDPQSVLRRAAWIDTVTVRGLQVDLQADAAGRFAFERVLPRRGTSAPASSSPMRWRIGRFVLSSARVRVADAAAGLAEPIDFAVPDVHAQDLGTWRRQTGRFAGTLTLGPPGAPAGALQVGGHLNLADATGDARLQIEALSLPWAAQRLRARPDNVLADWTATGGDLDATLAAQWRSEGGGTRISLRGLEVDVRNAALARGDVLHLGWQRLHAVAAVDLAARQASAITVTIDAPAVAVAATPGAGSMQAGGQRIALTARGIDWGNHDASGLAVDWAAPTVAVAATPGAGSMQAGGQRIAVTARGVDWGRHGASGFTVDWAAPTVAVAATRHRGSVHAAARNLQVAVGAVDWAARDASGLAVDVGAPTVAVAATRHRGSLRAAGRNLRVTAHGVDWGAREASGVAVVFEAPAVAVPARRNHGSLRATGRRIRMDANGIDWGARRVSGVTLAAHALALIRQAPKGAGPLRVFGSRVAVTAGTADLAARRIAVGGVDLAGFSWRRGRVRGTLAAAVARALRVDLRTHRIAVDAISARAGRLGRWSWRGSVQVEPFATDGAIAVQGLDLRALQPWLPQPGAVEIAGGMVSAHGALRVRTPKRGPIQVRFAGRAAADRLRVVDRRDGKPILSWRDVRVPRIAVDWPRGVQVPAVLAEGIRARIAIEPDHRLNWEVLLQGPHPAAVAQVAGVKVSGAAGSAAGAAATAPAGTRGPSPVIRIGRLVFADDAVDFTDATLASPFHARIRRLAGIIGPFASDAPQAWSRIDLHGFVNRNGHVAVTGRIAPMAKPLRADVAVHFRDIEMPTLNPFAMEIAGYRVDQGMLDLRLHYSVADGRIDGRNRMQINQLVLGRRVTGAEAPDLPLQAIIDVLQNDRGQIRLDVPVRGNLNDPNFVIRDVIYAAIRDSLRSAIDAPFHWIADLLGDVPETVLHHIDFAPGSAVLSAAERRKLQAIGTVLRAHPHLNVFVHPAYDAAADAAERRFHAATGKGAMRELAVHRAEAVKAVLVHAGVADRRVYIDEPRAISVTGTAAIPSAIDIRTR